MPCDGHRAPQGLIQLLQLDLASGFTLGSIKKDTYLVRNEEMLVCLLSWLPSYRVALGWLCPLTKRPLLYILVTTEPLLFLLLGSDSSYPLQLQALV